MSNANYIFFIATLFESVAMEVVSKLALLAKEN